MKAQIRKTALLWLIPFLFLVHNVEEAIFMRETLDQVRTGMPKFLRILIPPVSYEQFLVSLVLVTVVVFFFAFVGQLDRERGWGVYALLVVQAVLFLNVFAHLTTLIFVGSYTAGLGTALLINLPFSVYIFWRALRDRWIGPIGFGLLFPAGAVVHVPILFGFLYVSGFISRGLFGA
jgi:hypothetical protein